MFAQKKRLYFILFILTILVQFTFFIGVFALDPTESLIEDYVYEVDELLLDDDSLPVSVVLTPGSARIILDGSEVFLLGYGSREKRGFYTVGIDNYIADSCGGFDNNSYCKLSDEVLNGGQAIAELEILKHNPIVNIEYDIIEDEFFVGSTKEIEITITNEGDINLKNLVFRDEYPWDLFLHSPSKGKVVDNTIIYERSSLTKGSSVTFTVKVDIRAMSDTTQAGKLTYFDGKASGSVNADPLHIQTKSPLSIDMNFLEHITKDDVTTPTYNETYRFDLVLTNNAGSSFPITNLKVYFPPNFAIEKFDLPLQANVATISNSFTGSKTYSGIFKPLSDEMPITASYTFSGDIYDEEFIAKANVPASFSNLAVEITPTYSLTHDGLFIPEAKEQYFVSLTNSGDFRLEDISGTVSSDIITPDSFFIASLLPNQTVTLFEKQFTVPSVSAESTYFIQTDFQYVSNSTSYSNSDKKSITVKPLSDVVYTEYEILQPSTYERTVTGKIISELPYNVKIDMQLLHSLGDGLISDSSQYSKRIQQLEPEEERDVLSYSFFIPEDITETISTSFWANSVLTKNDISVSGPSETAGDVPSLDIEVKQEKSVAVGKKGTLLISFENKATTTSYDSIYFNFIPSNSIAIETFGRERIVSLLPEETFTKRIPFTVLKENPQLIGSVFVSYFSDDGTPFVFEERDISLNLISSSTNSSVAIADEDTPFYVQGNITFLNRAGIDETAKIVLENPFNKSVRGTFFVSNKTITYELKANEKKDYYYAVSHSEAASLEKAGLKVQTEQNDASISQQVLAAHTSSTAVGEESIIIEDNEEEETGESNIVLLSDEDSSNSYASQGLVYVSFFILVGLIGFFVVMVNIYKKKEQLRLR